MLIERLNDDIKEAMKARDKMRTSVLRMMLSEVKYAQSAVSMNEQLDDAAVQKVFATYQKKLEKSLNDFPEGEKKQAIAHEIAIVSEYLPKKASTADVENAIKEVLTTSTDRSFGPLMKQVMAKLGNAADGKVISELLKKHLT